jgi:hypothetical protein
MHCSMLLTHPMGCHIAYRKLLFFPRDPRVPRGQLLFLGLRVLPGDERHEFIRR